MNQDQTKIIFSLLGIDNIENEFEDNIIKKNKNLKNSKKFNK